MNNLIEQIEILINRKDYIKALELCNEELSNQDNELVARRQRAGIYNIMKQYDKSIIDSSYIIENLEPDVSDYYRRGMALLDNRCFYDAIDDFKTIINSVNDSKRDFFIESTHYLKAISHIQTKEWDYALTECECVRDGYFTWIIGLPISKEKIIEHIAERRVLK